MDDEWLVNERLSKTQCFLVYQSFRKFLETFQKFLETFRKCLEAFPKFPETSNSFLKFPEAFFQLPGFTGLVVQRGRGVTRFQQPKARQGAGVPRADSSGFRLPSLSLLDRPKLA